MHQEKRYWTYIRLYLFTKNHFYIGKNDDNKIENRNEERVKNTKTYPNSRKILPEWDGLW